MKEVKPSICRFCHALCPILVEMEDGKAVKVVGDKDNPLYHGYTCIKGRELPYYHYADERLTHSMKLQPDGSHKPIDSEQAMDEIAAKLKQLIADHGPRSVSIYFGTHGFNNFATEFIARAFMDAIESPMVFSSVTIDQPGKAVSGALHGMWLGGGDNIDDADAWMLVGTNPIVSQFGGMPVNPARQISKAKQRGAKLVVIDPRVTDVAKHADIHLQPKPGHDPTILAGIMRLIFKEGLYDQEFCTNHVNGFADLREAVEPFTPEFVAERADIPVDKLVAAARAYAQANRAAVTAGTGPNMAGHGNLTEYMVLSLMTLCGHWRKEGDKVTNPGVLINRPPAMAAAVGPRPAWGFGEKLRVRDLTDTAAGLPTAAAPEEILTDGEGQVKALLNLGGNPMMAWPDQILTFEAMKKLELLVSIDPLMTATCKLSHYIIAPKLTFEAPGTTALQEFLGLGGAGVGYQTPYAQYCETLQDPPEGSDVIEDWEFFYGVAQRLGRTLQMKSKALLDPAEAAKNATPLDGSKKPTGEEMWDILLKGSPVPLEDVKKHPYGKVFERPETRVAPTPPGWEGRLDIGNDVMMKELEEVYDNTVHEREKDYAFRMISRRLSDIHNSSWHTNTKLTRRFKYNPAFMNPADAKKVGVKSGDVIKITSQRASILGVVEEAPDVRTGSIAMSHSWGVNPDDERDDDVRNFGGNTGRLTDAKKDFDPYTGIPRMSSIPVNIERVDAA
jgi:anaerobic selenocysteine-containing dehydrogenase